MANFRQYLLENVQDSPLKTAVLDAYAKFEAISIPESLCREAHEYISTVNYPQPKGCELRVFASTEPLALTQQNRSA